MTHDTDTATDRRIRCFHPRPAAGHAPVRFPHAGGAGAIVAFRTGRHPTRAAAPPAAPIASARAAPAHHGAGPDRPAAVGGRLPTGDRFRPAARLRRLPGLLRRTVRTARKGVVFA